MEIIERRIKVSEIFDGYFNDDEEGVVGYHGQLDIRPKYQRELVYDDDEQRAVIRSVLNNLPLNVMYWIDRWQDPDNPTQAELETARYEVLDGQQRTLSLCRYLHADFSVDDMVFFNMPKDKQDAINNYRLFVYICRGTESEKLEWFKIVNIAGKRLSDQERRNAVYAGPWISSAKRYFSKSNGAAYTAAHDLLKGTAIRQEYLETAIGWLAEKEGMTIEQYMSAHQYDASAVQMWNYFRSVIDWVRDTFPFYRKEMKGQPWGILYNHYGQRTDLDPDVIESRIKQLMIDDDISNRRGIYEYILSGDERKLSFRAFDARDIRAAYEKQQHKCAICGKEFLLENMHADHIIAWSKGGRTIRENCQMLCRDCNLKKGAQ